MAEIANLPLLDSPSDSDRPESSHRRRTRRACDQCSRARVRCNGHEPCFRCREYRQQCSFQRPVRRRGRKAANRLLTGPNQDEPCTAPSPPTGAEPSFLSISGVTTQPKHGLEESLPLPWQTPDPELSSSYLGPRQPAIDANTPPVESSCRYPCLIPLLPDFDGILDLSAAVSLLDHYFSRPNVSLFRAASPYVLDPIVRKVSLQGGYRVRETSALLTLTMLWVATQSACIRALLVPRKRKNTCEKLEALLIDEINQKGTKQATRSCVTSIGQLESVAFEPYIFAHLGAEISTESTDGLLCCILIAIVISGSDSKGDALPWYHAAVRIARRLDIHQLDAGQWQATRSGSKQNFADEEAREEKRRLFWLLFSIDRHWALCYNAMPLLMDQDCKVFTPLDNATWESPDLSHTQLTWNRTYGPPVHVTGFGYFQWFLPLMTVLGDIVWMHQQQAHPRMRYGISAWLSADLECMLETCLKDIDALELLDKREASCSGPAHLSLRGSPGEAASTAAASMANSSLGGAQDAQERDQRAVRLYAKFVVHVLHILLHGRWDALDLLTREDQFDTSDGFRTVRNGETGKANWRIPLSDWITSEQFTKCSSHAIAASEVLAQILSLDPELSLVPYLFGIYLLQGSFILLFFADRMLEVGGSPNPSVEKACETVIRAHEASFTTLSVEFQRDFRKVLRIVLNNVHHARHQGVVTAGRVRPGYGEPVPTRALQSEQHELSVGRMEQVIWREVLGLYRWTPGASGLATWDHGYRE